MTIATFTLRSATTQANAPFVLGHAFKQGDVPSGSQLVASISDFQFTPKNVWPDGSLKFAVLAGRAALTGGVDLNVPLSIGTPADSGYFMAGHELETIGVVASIACGAFGTAIWSGTDWGSPFATWISGQRMSSFIYRKPVGVDAHLVAWLEVRVWSGGAVEILPWIENGYTTVAAPTNKSDTYTFTLGGTQRFSAPIDLKHHQRTPLISGAMLSHWLGTDPGVSARHDVGYLQASELVPSYGAVSSTTTLAAILPTTFVPLQKGGFSYDSDYMPSTGYQSPIGLLPAHDVAYLVCADDPKRVYEAVIRNGFSSGRYGIHYREPATNRPLRFSSYPTLVVADGQGFGDTGSSTTNSRTPVATGGNPPLWDSAHHPSVGYMAYLVTGRYYFMEQIQFAATANYLNNGDNSFLRTGALGLHQTAAAAHQTRSCAWDWRTHAQALSASPDGDTIVRPELVNSYVSNIDAFHTKYAGQTNNPGWIYPGENYGQQNLIAAWQQDFVTAAWGMALCLDLPIPAPQKIKEAALFQWKAKSVVIRLDATAYNNTPYVTKVAAPDNPNYVDGTGVFYQSGAEINTQTLLTPNGYYATTPPYYSSTQNVLAIEDPSLWGYSMNSQLLAAAAYAVRHGVPNAAPGRNRVLAAANYSSMANAFTAKPVWSVTPSTTGASIVPTPGPTMRVGQLLAGKMAISGFRGRGITPGQVATGFAEASLLEQHIVGADPTSEFLWVADSVQAGLTFNINEDSSFAASGADGVYNGTKTVRINGAEDPGTYQMAFGEPASEITGVTISPTTATGSTTFTKTVSGTGSFSSAGSFSKISGGGSINPSTGAFVPPAQTGSIQVTVVRFTSDQDPNKWAEATITIAALAADTTGPTMAGPITPSAITSTGFRADWPVATDSNGIAEYRYRINGGSLISNGLNRFKVFSGLSAASSYTLEVLAYDPSGNPTGAPLTIDVATLAQPAGPTLVAKTIVVTLKTHNLALQANVSGIYWTWSDARGIVTSFGGGLSADAAGNISIPILTALLSDATGFLMLDNYDGGNPLTYFGFAGPVRVP